MLSQDYEHQLLFDLMERLLEYEPLKRITAWEALRHPFFSNEHPQISASRLYGHHHHPAHIKNSLSSSGSGSETD